MAINENLAGEDELEAVTEAVNPTTLLKNESLALRILIPNEYSAPP
jgi:hypothetical protein